MEVVWPISILSRLPDTACAMKKGWLMLVIFINFLFIELVKVEKFFLI